MYDTNLVRRLCGRISTEKDAQKTEDLVSLLQAVIRDDIEEIRARIAFLRQKYGSALAESSLEAAESTAP